MLKSYGVDMESVEHKFERLKHSVKLVFFTHESHCAHCGEARKLFSQIASVTRKIEFEAYNFAIDVDKDREYGISAVPSVAIIGEKDFGIRYYGCPRGIELINFLDDIVYISRGENTLPLRAAELLRALNRKTELKIFISPTCPYSLPLVKTAIKLAIASERINVDIIDAGDFLETGEKYNVRGVPMTVVNEQKSFYGALDEEEYIKRVLTMT